MAKKRKNHTPQEKTVILREHLINQVPVSDLCDQHGVHPTMFYRWQKKLFENLPRIFENSRSSELTRLRKENAILREKLGRKDTIIAQIMEDFVAVKKSYGDL